MPDEDLESGSGGQNGLASLWFVRSVWFFRRVMDRREPATDERRTQIPGQLVRFRIRNLSPWCLIGFFVRDRARDTRPRVATVPVLVQRVLACPGRYSCRPTDYEFSGATRPSW